MLRVGLTGGLGAGKSTVARMLAERGAVVLESDAIGRELMQPGQAVYAAIVERFGAGVVRTEGELDRPALARLAFAEGETEALNAIVHPAVIARQERLIEEIAARDREAIVVIESALIFETKYSETKSGEIKYGETTSSSPERWRERFDRLVLVMAAEAVKIARFVVRAGGRPDMRPELEREARRRLALQMPDAAKVPFCDFVLRNDAGLVELEPQVERIWLALRGSEGILR